MNMIRFDSSMAITLEMNCDAITRLDSAKTSYFKFQNWLPASFRTILRNRIRRLSEMKTFQFNDECDVKRQFEVESTSPLPN